MRLALVLAASLAVGSLGAGAAHARPRTALATTSTRSEPRAPSRTWRVAQQPSALELAIAAAQRADKVRLELVARRVQLATRYQSELAEIDRLKRQPPSWRRDRALRSKLASSLETATTMAALAERIKRAGAEVTRTRAVAIAAIDRALPLATGAYRSELERRRRSWAPAPAPSRRIVIPDDALDPLADPEELEQQAGALRDSEAELGREVDRLEQQVTRFDRMAAVRKQHDRAEELDRRDDADPRRVAVRSGNESASDDDSAAPGAEADPGTSSGGLGPSPDSRDLSTSLADVVDPGTVDALRRAERSTDPAIRAAGARRAREAVAQRLATLRKRRAAIEGRARELRAQSPR